MSRIGRLAIPVPAGVAVTLEGAKITVAGPRGTLSRELVADLRVVQEDGLLRVERPDDTKRNSASSDGGWWHRGTAVRLRVGCLR